MNEKLQTDFLFAQPSFSSGIARTLDLWGGFDDYNISATGPGADANAIASDWLNVGGDIWGAIERQESEMMEVA